MFGGAGEHLPGSDRGVELVGEHGVGVVGVEGFLDPGQLEAFELPADAERGNPIPLLVRVDHQSHIFTQRGTYPPPGSDRSVGRVVQP
jgi:hypothetical protein